MINADNEKVFIKSLFLTIKDNVKMCTIFIFVRISIFSSKEILIGYLLLYLLGRTDSYNSV